VIFQKRSPGCGALGSASKASTAQSSTICAAPARLGAPDTAISRAIFGRDLPSKDKKFCRPRLSPRSGSPESRQRPSPLGGSPPIPCEAEPMPDLEINLLMKETSAAGRSLNTRRRFAC
jgi:hypothetical protein